MKSRVVLYHGDCRDLLRKIPEGIVQLVVTSPPYNNGKGPGDRVPFEDYVALQWEVISRCAALLRPGGSLCWEVGNHIPAPREILPLDIALYPAFVDAGLTLRNRIVWHFEHGLHCRYRFSGRYETILWWTKRDDYTFHLDPIRVPQKYPAKRAYHGPRKGEPSCNPIGKNPGDVWVIPNVKHNHVEKVSGHPCQFPVELIERFVLALTDENDIVLDPFMGVGTTPVAALRLGRRAIGAEIVKDYVRVARARVNLALEGRLRTRPMDRPVYSEDGHDRSHLEGGASAEVPRPDGREDPGGPGLHAGGREEPSRDRAGTPATG